MADKTKPQLTNIFKFVYQKSPRKPVHVYTIREDEHDQIYAFCKRLAQVNTLPSLEFAEIQRMYDDGSVGWVWGSPQKPMPKGVKILTHEGIVARKRTPDEHYTTNRRVVTTSINKENRQLPVIKAPETPGLLTKELSDTNVAFTLPLKIKVA